MVSYFQLKTIRLTFFEFFKTPFGYIQIWFDFLSIISFSNLMPTMLFKHFCCRVVISPYVLPPKLFQVGLWSTCKSGFNGHL